VNRRFGEAAQRYAERRRREDEAPRLLAVIPNLESLELRIEERTGESRVAEAPHIRRIAVANAPALFYVPCRDAACREGGHDLTQAIMRELQSGRSEFDSDDACMGQVGSTTCQRVLHYAAVATYR